MLGLQLVVALGSAVVLGNLVGRRTGVAVPVVLLVLGLALSRIPAFTGVGISSDVVLLLFLPPLLFWESLTTSSREIRRFLRGITLSGTLLVVVTAAVIALVGHALGLAWGTAWIIGAALAPTDATAVAALGRTLPRGLMTVLRGESLINDGTALVVFALALELATGEAEFTFAHVGVLALLSFGGGLVVGIIGGRLTIWIRARMSDPVLMSVIQMLTPFVVYLLAEEIHASGVLAVVVCGLVAAHLAPRAITARARAQSTPVWTQATFILNGALFVLIGLALPGAIGSLSVSQLATGVLLTGTVYVAMLGTRLLFLNVTMVIIRTLDRRPQQRRLRATARMRVVNTIAGFRGAVSLAVALATPASLNIEQRVPARDMIVFVVAGVVTTSLVVQGFLLPHVIRWARLPRDLSEAEEFDLATKTAAEEMLEALPEIAGRMSVSPEIMDEVRHELLEHRHTWTASREDDASEEAGRLRQFRDLRLGIIAHKRATVVRLRDERVIDDTVLRRIQSRLDIDELRVRGPVETE